jgi:hypothetical protein
VGVFPFVLDGVFLSARFGFCGMGRGVPFFERLLRDAIFQVEMHRSFTPDLSYILNPHCLSWTLTKM